jgi:zinc/manganese transport system permease protein
VLSHAFVQNALLAGSAIALASGTLGWFVVLRAELFAADALAHVAFVGAIAAVVLGLDERIGLFALTLASAAALTILGPRARADDVVVGISFAWILGIGILLITLLASSSHAGNGISAVNTLFGSIYSLTAGASRAAAAVGIGVLVATLIIFRPLLSATLEPELAMLRGVRVRLVGAVFLGLLAVLTAQGTPAIGALLVLGLLAAPAGAARLLVRSPYRGAALAATFALISVWSGIALSYAIRPLPPSSAIVGIAAAIYAAAAALRGVRMI